MKRSTGPWLRTGRGWYVCHGGKQRKLAPASASKAQATEAWHQLLAAPGLPVARPLAGEVISAVEVVDRFLDWVSANRKPATLNWLRTYLAPWARSIGLKPALLVVGYDVTSYADRRQATNAVRRAIYRGATQAFRWAEEQGLIDRNPIKRLRLPASHARDRVLSPKEIDKICAAASPAFLALFRVCLLTGCRPREAMTVEVRHLDFENRRWVFSRKEGKKERLRIVYCSKEAWAIVEAGAKEGRVFRNSKDKPWNKSAVNCAVRRLRASTGVKGWCLNTTRHTWATNKLAAGVSPAIVAQLMGHADLSMLSGVYGHLEQREESLRSAIE